MHPVGNKLVNSSCKFNVYFYVRHDSKSSSSEEDNVILSDDAASPVCITSSVEDKVSLDTI